MKIIQALVMSLLSMCVYAQDTNVFESVTIGFKVTKPTEWQFVTAEEHLENLERIQLNDKEFHQRMLKYSTVPLVAIAKYPPNFDDLNPSFKVNIKPFGQLKGTDPKKVLDLVLSQFQTVFQDFKSVQEPIDTLVGKLPAAYTRISYSMVIPDGRKFPTVSELWIVPKGDYFFLIGAGTRQDEKTGSRDEIAKIIASVEF